MACVALLSFSVTAIAQTFSETFTAAYCLKNLTGPNPFALPSFNTQLGTLDNIQLSFKFELNPVLTVDNSTNAVLRFTNALITESIDVSRAGSFNFSTLLDADVKTGLANPGLTTDVLKPTPGSGSVPIAPSDFALWENQPGQRVHFEMTPGLPSVQEIQSGTGLGLSDSGDIWGALILKYTYTKASAAPEPPGGYLTALAGLAMILIGYGRRRMSRL